MSIVIIRHSKNKLIFLISALSLMLLLVLGILRDGIKKYPFFATITAIGFLIPLLYAIREIIVKKSVIIISEVGIKLRNKGFIAWNLIRSYNTYEQPDAENGKIDYIAIHLKNQIVLRQNISGLDKTKEEIILLIKQFRPDLIDLGHVTV
jgi:hypothetical protein